MKLTPEFKATAKMHLKNIRTAAWVLGSEVLAPAVIIGTVGAAAKLSHWQFLLYMLASNMAWWRILGALKQKPVFNFRIRHITHLPAEGAADWDAFKDAETQDHIDEDRNLKPHTVLILRDNTFYQIPTECRADAIMMVRALNDFTSDNKQIEFCCPKGHEMEAMAKMSKVAEERDGKRPFHPDHDNHPESNCNCPSCR